MVVINIWCAVFMTSQLTSRSCFQTNVWAKFFDIIRIFFYIHSLYFGCHCTEYKLSAPQVRISVENNLNAATQQFITAKISGCALNQGIKIHSSMRQCNSQLQNEAALMSCRIRAVEHRKSVAGLSDAHPGLQDRILLNYTRIGNAHKISKKLSIFCYLLKSSKFLVFLFPC